MKSWWRVDKNWIKSYENWMKSWLMQSQQNVDENLMKYRWKVDEKSKEWPNWLDRSGDQEAKVRLGR
jgi:hypothetical protein